MNAVRRVARSLAVAVPVSLGLVITGLYGASSGALANGSGASLGATLGVNSSPFGPLAGGTPRATTTPRPAGVERASLVRPAIGSPPEITTVSPPEGATEGQPGNLVEITRNRGVKITGSELTGATEVKFGGIPAAAFKVLSATEIQAEPPAEEPLSPEDEGGFVSVSVTTPGGTVEKPGAYRYGPVVESVEEVEAGRNEGPTNPPTRCLETEKTIAECSEGSIIPRVRCVKTEKTLEECPNEGEREGATAAVKIRGHGFVAGATTVNFGERCSGVGTVTSKSCSTIPNTAWEVKVSENGTLIEALAPQYNIVGSSPPFSTGTPVDVTVTSPNGTSPKSAADKYYFGPSIESVSPNEGPREGGTTVQIKGHGFEAPQLICKIGGDSLSECPAAERAIQNEKLVQSVKFTKPGGSITAAFTVKSATEIEATVPLGETGFFDVAVTTAETGEEGTQTMTSPATEADRYFYGANITSVTPGGAPAGGGLVTLKGHGFEACKVSTETLAECPEESERNKAEEVSFGGVPASAFEVKSPEEIVVPAAPAHAAEVVEIKVKIAGGVATRKEPDLYAYGVPYIERLSPPEGDETGNSEVTIIGGNFNHVQEVLFEGRKASVIEVKNEHEIRALTPREIGVGPVEVVTETGRTPAGAMAPQYTALPEPQVLKLEPNSAAFGGGTRIKIRGRNFGGAKAVEFGGVPASFTVKSTGENGATGAGEIVATAPASPPRSEYVRVVARGGTSAPTQGAHFTFAGWGIQPGSFQVAACGTPFNPAVNPEEPITHLEPLCNYEDSSASEFFTQASATPPSMIVSFALNATEVPQGEPGNQQPAGILKSARVDFPPGFNFDIQNVKEKCPYELFKNSSGQACPVGSWVGVAEVTGSTATILQPGADETIFHPVYAIEPPFGVPAELGFNSLRVGAHEPQIFVRGGLSSSVEPQAEHNGLVTGDYHVFSSVEQINDQETPGVSSRIILAGQSANGPFVTMPSQCTSSLTYHLRVESYSHAELTQLVPPGVGNEVAEGTTTTHAPSGNIGVTGCNNKVPFHPTVEMTPETGAAGAPDGATITVKVPHGTNPDTADPHSVTVELPEGMTVNPSSANGLEGCTDKQFGIKETEPGSGVFDEHPLRTEEGEVHCPPASKIGTFQVKTPDLPTEACKTPGKVFAECPTLGEREQTPLEGSIYVAQPVAGKGPESGEMYRVFLAAESKRFGVQVRQLGAIVANPQTGRLKTIVETPQLPFSEATVHINGGQKASLANPVGCSAGGTVGTFVPYGGPEGPATAQSESPFNLANCPFSPPFSLSQAAGTASTQAGANTTFALEWTRARGQAYLAATNTTLPPGLTGSIASVPVLCNEEQANAGACPAASQIGTVLTAAGEGEPEPGESPYNSKNLITLGGQVYLTTGYQGSPYGLAIVVPAEHVGPYNLGKIVTRAGIQVNEETAQVTTTSAVPTIVSGAPVRLRAIQILLNRAGFIRNATHCSAGSIESTLYGTGTLPASNLIKDELKTPYAATGCSALPFKPVFTSTTSANTSRQNGATLTVKYTQNPGESNIQRVETQLPFALPSRLTTLQKACTEGAFAANPASCPAASNVGTVVAHTPLLNTPLTGTAILVSHGGRAYPDLDFVLHEVAGVKVRVVGHTEIKNGITYSRFENVPDTPVSSFELTLPSGPNSLLGANGSFCTETTTSKKKVALRKNGKVVRKKGHVVFTTQKTTHLKAVSLVMPTTMVGQNGAKMVQQTQIAVQGCQPSAGIEKVKVQGNSVLVTVSLTAAGKVTLSGKGLKTTHKSLSAGAHQVKVPLTRAGKKLKRHHTSVKVKVTLSSGGSTSSNTLKFAL
jgi:hypothetical protein